jgi:hypothetical protein
MYKLSDVHATARLVSVIIPVVPPFAPTVERVSEATAKQQPTKPLGPKLSEVFLEDNFAIAFYCFVTAFILITYHAQQGLFNAAPPVGTRGWANLGNEMSVGWPHKSTCVIHCNST